jgi:exodeoxyribonuclease V alpha subunit
MKTYRGSPAGARNYVEAGRARADDYYLAEGTGIADRYAATPGAAVRRLAPLTGEKYEAWVAGVDPDTGVPKGRLRHDEHAVRFVEVAVNGPKSWSLAAALHPDISAAYDAAQDAAAAQVIAWLAEHATVRVGGRGAQVQVPVQEIEAVVVRHHTSRAGDPHRHLHLQINARVRAEGRWYGLHTVGVRDSLDAINGIGHAAMATDAGFRAALAAHGFTVNPGTGEIRELAKFVGPFSSRAAQIGRNIDRYEANWRTANPGREPGPRLRRGWDARAWADARPDKVTPVDGAQLTADWVAELHALGYREPAQAVLPDATPVGAVDREAAVGEVLARLAHRRSAWNAADVRGEIERLIARRNIVTNPAVRRELAEDLTARSLTRCVLLLDRPGVPEHIRALTSRHVLEVEADLVGRLAARGNAPLRSPAGERSPEVDGLDAGQREVVTALAGERALVLVEGAAGAGKTTTLTAARAALASHGARLVVVTPTLKAAQVAARQLGTPASSAAKLAHRHGWRWDGDGGWTRLAVGQVDPHTGTVYPGPGEDARLRAGDLLLCDEAGMLDQDTARALLTLADECGARVALVGDRHQLCAVGRGGLLDLAARWSDPGAQVSLEEVHRFIRTIANPDGTLTTVADEQYAQLSLAMRAGQRPEGLFDALAGRGEIVVHASETERLAALADHAAQDSAAGSAAVVIADTREQVAALNAAIRDRLIAIGRVDDAEATVTGAGDRIGVGDRVITRRNDRQLNVANRDSWTVTDVHPDGSIAVDGEHGHRTLPAGYVGEHVELGYASTVHGVQGETTIAAHLAMGEHTTAASAYVGMTRGRQANTAHLVADSIDDAREQWVAAFARDRADLGPAHAAELAAGEASRYAIPRPLETALGELHAAWTVEQDCRDRLAVDVGRRDLLAEIVPLREARERDVPPLQVAWQQAVMEAHQARERATAAERTLTSATDRYRDGLLAAWDTERRAAAHAARIVRAGSGWLGQRHKAVAAAREHLSAWAERWRPLVPDLPVDTAGLLARLDRYEYRPRLWEQLDPEARRRAAAEHPDAVAARHTAQVAEQTEHAAWQSYHDTDQHYRNALAHYGNLAHTEHPERKLADLNHCVTATTDRLHTAQDQIESLLAEPALRALPPDRIPHERDRWHADRDAREAAREAAATLRLTRAAAAARAERDRHGLDIPHPTPYHAPAPQHGHGIGI